MTIPAPTVQVIAELGINHGGDPDTAIQMIEAAAEAGCAGVKVQSYRVQDFLPPVTPTGTSSNPAKFGGRSSRSASSPTTSAS